MWSGPALVVALAAGDVTSTGDALWVPGGMFLTAAGLLFKASTTYKEARQIDVDGAKKRETEAETELVELRKARDAIKADRDERIDDLSAEVQALRAEVGRLRGEHRTTMRDQEVRHASELEAVHRRLEREIRVAYRLRELAALHDLPIPDELMQADHGLGEDRS